MSAIYTPGFKVVNDEPGTVLREPFAVDADRGLVIFGDPMYRDEAASSRRIAKAPDSTLVTSFHVRVPGTNNLLCYEAREPPMGSQTGGRPMNATGPSQRELICWEMVCVPLELATVGSACGSGWPGTTGARPGRSCSPSASPA